MSDTRRPTILDVTFVCRCGSVLTIHAEMADDGDAICLSNLSEAWQWLHRGPGHGWLRGAARKARLAEMAQL